MTKETIIDETFAGLVAPSETHSVGRPDIDKDRPGDILVAEVRKFGAEGGFRRIAEERTLKRAAENAADRSVPKEELPDFGLRLQSGEGKALEISDGDD